MEGAVLGHLKKEHKKFLSYVAIADGASTGKEALKLLI